MSGDDDATTAVASDSNTVGSDDIAEQLIEIMEHNDGLCVHPLHYHSFQLPPNGIHNILSSAAVSSVVSVHNFLHATIKQSSSKTTSTSFASSDRNSCILCGEQFSTLPSRMILQAFHKLTVSSTSKDKEKKRDNETTALKCVACNVFAHRSCATSIIPVDHCLCTKLSDTNYVVKGTKARQQTIAPNYTIHQQCSVNRHKIFQPATSPKMDSETIERTTPVDVGVKDNEILDHVVTEDQFHQDNEQIIQQQTQQPQHRKAVTEYPGNRVQLVQSQDDTTDFPVVRKEATEEQHCQSDAVQSNSTLKKNGNLVRTPNQLLHSVKQNVSMTAVAGGIAGGIAGMALIGPAGAVYACYLGVGGINVLLGLESAATLSVVAAGIATGTITANKLHDHIDVTKQRIITMSDPNRRTVLLVRPNITVDPIWDQICLDAIKSAPKSAYSSKRHNNHQLHADIIDTNEDEIDTHDKILLLVSRILNDKTSLPGYVLRYLIESFNDRCRHRTIICANNQSIVASNPRIRRDDAHATIKHVTATVMNVRPELGSSPRFTELTASAVESIVFGQIYDSVLEEIIHETLDDDVELWRKVTILLKQHPELLLKVQCHDQNIDTNIKGYNNPTTTTTTKSTTNHKHLPLVSSLAMETLKMVHQARSVSDKLHFCVKFIDCLSAHYTKINTTKAVFVDNNNISNNSSDATADNDISELLCADTLIQMVCQHIILVENYGNLYAQIRFIEEFASDEQLIHGYDGYALVTIQAALQVLQQKQENKDPQGEREETMAMEDWYNDIFG